jgi:hypothetical protein
LRASSIGRRSACTDGVHQGEGGGESGRSGKGGLFIGGTGGFGEFALSAAPKHQIKGVWTGFLPLH